jgi:hypothetical protein
LIFFKIIYFLWTGVAGQRGDCIQAQPIVNTPGFKGDSGLPGLSGKKLGFEIILIHFSFLI